MKKITFLFALLCASVMSLRAAASYSGNIAGELNSYTYDIDYVITYTDNHTLTFTADFTGTFSETVGLVLEVWSSDLTGNFRSFSKGSGSTWTATDTKNFESMEGQALSQLRLRIASQAGGTDQLFISGYTVGLDNSGSGGGSTPDPEPAPGEKFVKANADIDHSYFANWEWAQEYNSTASYNKTTGEITVHIDNDKNIQWYAQVHFALGFAYTAGKYYDFSIKFRSDKAVNQVTLKTNDDNALFYQDQNVSIPANEDYVWTKSDVLGVAGNNIFVFDFGHASENTNITISEISIIEKDAPSAPAVVTQYCRFATGQNGNPEHGDVNGRILLTLRKVSDTSVRVKVEPNNNGNDYFDVVKVEVAGVPQEMGNVHGAALTNMEFLFDGLSSLDFNVNVLWHNHNWADVNGRWSTGNIAITEAELCTEETALTVGSEYCCYYGDETKSGSHYATLTWETNEDGDVVITIGEGPGEHNTAFRGNGLGNNLDGFSVLSGEGFATDEAASVYFNRVYSGVGGKTYTLQKKGGVTLPSPAKIRFYGKPFEWTCTENGNAYTENKTFVYTYGTICSQLDAPTNVAVDADSIITFNTVVGATKYTAYVYLAGVEKYQQEVASGDVLHFWPYEDGDYHVNVVAWGTGKVESDPSTDYVWSLLERTVVLGNSEYCTHTILGDDTETKKRTAYFTWETDASGNIVITISEALGGAASATHFRGNALALANFTVGAGHAAGSNYFSHPGTTTGDQLVLTVTNAPALGEKIYYHGVVEYATSEQTDAWPTLDFEWTYGTVCSGFAVSAAPNNSTMGSAVVKKGDDVVTSVEDGDEVNFIATVADAELYRFVNWTKGGVEVSTLATYTTTISEVTNLVANFDYIRNTYCHYPIQATAGAATGKSIYMTLGSIGNGQYQIKYEGTAEVQLTALSNADYVVNGVSALVDVDGKAKSGNNVPFTYTDGRWSFDATAGYGTAQMIFELAENKTIDDIFVWGNTITFQTTAGAFIYEDNQTRNKLFGNPAPLRHNIDWNSTCADAEAPVFAKAEGAVLDATSVRLTIQASDNWEGILTYTIARAGAEPIISNHASGEEFAQNVTGLTTGTEYDFTVTVSDGVNNANTHILVTPVGDNTPPVWNSASLVSYGCYSAVISVDASDAFGIASIYVVELDADYVPAEGKITITGLTPNTDYSFTLKAKDPAGNSSDPSDAIEFKTKSDVPTSAAPTPTWPTNQVKSIYSDTYDDPATCSYSEGWWTPPTMENIEMDANNHYLKYSGNMSGMVGWQFTEMSVATMEYVHVDIWPSVDGTITMGPTSADDPNRVASVTKEVIAGQWNSFEISMAELQAANANFDPAKLFQNQFTGYSAQTVFSVDNVFFYRTTPPPADLAAPTDVTVNSTAASFTSVIIKAQANDDSGVVHFKVLNGTDVLVADVEALSGAEATLNVTGLTHSTAYTLSLIAFDEAGHEAEPVAVAVSTQSVPAAAPQPTHDELAVLSVYSSYAPAVAASFNKSNWGSAPVAYEADYLLYNMSSNVIVWGNNDGNAGHGNIDGLSGKTHETTPGLDVSEMKYIHFDVWCDKADQLNTVNINDVAVSIPTTRTVAGEWVSFDVDITGVALADRQNVRWLKFHPFSTTECNAAIDNVYFYKDPEYTRDDSWMAPGELGTVCYPQGLLLAGAIMYKMAGTDANGKFVFDEVNELEPGVPYLFEATADVIHFYATDATPATVAGESNGMKGTFEPITIPQNSPNIYYFSGQKFYAVTARQTDLTVPANRAYVDLTEPHPAMAPKPGIRRITFDVQGANTTTGIDNFDASETPVKVMIDGQLYILRGEKMYDAQGRMVK